MYPLANIIPPNASFHIHSLLVQIKHQMIHIGQKQHSHNESGKTNQKSGLNYGNHTVMNMGKHSILVLYNTRVCTGKKREEIPQMW
jgi:hypothetical protein